LLVGVGIEIGIDPGRRQGAGLAVLIDYEWVDYEWVDYEWVDYELNIQYPTRNFQ